MSLISLDIETYPNYFLIAFKSLSGKVKTLELKGKMDKFCNYDKGVIYSALVRNKTFGFNSLNFDIPLILASLNDYTTRDLNFMANSIIENRLKVWEVYSNYNLSRNQTELFFHFDLKEVAVGANVSLKLYGARLHSKKLQDLPIKPYTELSPLEFEQIKIYCINDLDTTIDLYNAIKPKLDVRYDMVNDYGYGIVSKSDAQIAELVIKTELKKINPNINFNEKINKSAIIYNPPKFINFKTEILNNALSKIKNTSFLILDNGSVELSDEIKKLNIKIGLSNYQLGIGGLHSKEKSQVVIPNNNQYLIDKDVTSYYPSIILNLGLYPKQLTKDFLTIYNDLVSQRLQAKKSGDKVKSEVLKIVINGSYGKFGSKYSALYAPDLMIAVTLTGQLALLMLIEDLELNGIKVVSANTDGVVSLLPKDKITLYEDLCQDWELKTGFSLESNEYKALYSRDVNSYIAITNDGHKCKGVFTKNELSKNPQMDVCIEAVIDYLKNNIPLEKTINENKDITKFLNVRSVTGGAVYKGEYLGKVVRFYYSKNGTSIHYAKNNNKVPNSDNCKPFMDISEFPDDVDFNKYIDKAYELLENLGLAGRKLF